MEISVPSVPWHRRVKLRKRRMQCFQGFAVLETAAGWHSPGTDEQNFTIPKRKIAELKFEEAEKEKIKKNYREMADLADSR